jgi:hypothetical protein
MAIVQLITNLPQTRLTFNYWRRGGYQVGSEDYRWWVEIADLPQVQLK